MTTLTDPESGLPVQVVEPGSPGDPFAPKPAETSTPSPAVQASQTAQVPAGGGGEAPPVQPPATQAAPPSPPAPGMTEAQVQEMIRAQLEAASAEADERYRQLQSTADRQINQLRTQAEGAAAEKRELIARQRQLEETGLTDEEKARLRSQHELEDQRAELQAYGQELESYHKGLEISSLLIEFGTYGVTEEHLQALESPEEMEALCYEAKADWLEQRQNQTAAQAAAPATPPPAPPPAASLQTSDMGGGGIPPEQPKFVTDQGHEALQKNISASKWEKVALPY